MIVISDLLPQKYPDFVKNLIGILNENEIKFSIISETKDIWCRDYLPVKVREGKYVQFVNDPYYLKGFEDLKTTPELLDLKLDGEVINSDLVVDGGNVIKNENVAFLTDQVITDNRGITKPALIDQLRYLLEVDQVIILPHEPYDTFRHSDGMIRFIDDKTVLINDFSYQQPYYRNQVIQILKSAGFEVRLLPSYSTNAMNRFGDYDAEGCYINFIELDNKSIMYPIYHHDLDVQVAYYLRQYYPAYRLIPIDCTTIAKEGGSLHCVVWND